jgi:hypothetical protein
VIRYHFLPSNDTNPDEEQAVRDAMATWLAGGANIRFEEVGDPMDADVRILIDFGLALSRSHTGTDCSKIDPPAPTTWFGQSLRDEEGMGVALHEIGHVLGLTHEHQNPDCPIEWNEDEVFAHYASQLSKPDIRLYVLDKAEDEKIEGTETSRWDGESVMHYDIPAKLIRAPADLARDGVRRSETLSKGDEEWVIAAYAP